MISLFSLSVIINRYGTGIILFTVIVCLVGIVIYICEMKDQNCIDNCFKEGTISDMFRIPCFIINLVRYTFDCYKCDYIVTTIIYKDNFGYTWAEDN